MPLSNQETLQIVMQARGRISAAAWVVVHDAHAAEDIFQNVALKVVGTDLTLEADPSSTRVRVYDGQVRVLRLCDGRAVDVPVELENWWCCTVDTDIGLQITSVEISPGEPQMAALPKADVV